MPAGLIAKTMHRFYSVRSRLYLSEARRDPAVPVDATASSSSTVREHRASGLAASGKSSSTATPDFSLRLLSHHLSHEREINCVVLVATPGVALRTRRLAAARRLDASAPLSGSHPSHRLRKGCPYDRLGLGCAVRPSSCRCANFALIPMSSRRAHRPLHPHRHDRCPLRNNLYAIPAISARHPFLDR